MYMFFFLLHSSDVVGRLSLESVSSLQRPDSKGKCVPYSRRHANNIQNNYKKKNQFVLILSHKWPFHLLPPPHTHIHTLQPVTHLQQTMPLWVLLTSMHYLVSLFKVFQLFYIFSSLLIHPLFFPFPSPSISSFPFPSPLSLSHPLSPFPNPSLPFPPPLSLSTSHLPPCPFPLPALFCSGLIFIQTLSTHLS